MKVKEAREEIEAYRDTQQVARELMAWCQSDQTRTVVKGIESAAGIDVPLKTFLARVITLADFEIARVSRIIDEAEVKIY